MAIEAAAFKTGSSAPGGVIPDLVSSIPERHIQHQQAVAGLEERVCWVPAGPLAAPPDAV